MALRAACAVADITPPWALMMGGYAARTHSSEGVHDPLKARALLVEQDGTRVCLVSCDLLGLQQPFVDVVCADIAGRTGLPADRVLICCTHTHAGPNTLSLLSFGPIENGYLDWLRPRLVDLVDTVCTQPSRPAVVRFGRSRSALGVNRRVRQPDGRVALSVNPQGHTDPEVCLVRVDAPDGQPIASVLNYGCHAVTRGSDNYQISADFPGAVVREVESTYGGTCLFTNAGFGNVAPHRRGTDFDAVDANGRELFGAVQQAWESCDHVGDPRLDMVVHDVHLPLAALPTRDQAVAQLDNALQKVRHVQADSGLIAALWPRVQCEHFRLVLAEHAIGQYQTHQTVRIPVIGLGPIVMVGLPGEAFSQIVERIKHASPRANAFCVGLANDEVGYLPTAEAQDEGGYETEAYMFFGPCRFARDMDSALVEGSIEAIGRLQGP